MAKADAEYLYRMEDLLDLYAEAYDPKYPVVCFDEMPIRLLENLYPEIPARPDKPHIPRKQDYSYEPYGIQNALVFFEPLAGKREITISSSKTKAVFAQQIERLNELYPDAKRIRLVMDNYATHKLSACYEVFEPEEARRLTERIEVVPPVVKEERRSIPRIRALREGQPRCCERGAQAAERRAPCQTSPVILHCLSLLPPGVPGALARSAGRSFPHWKVKGLPVTDV